MAATPPAVTPTTTPVAAFMVAIAGLLIDHEPPETVLARMMAEPEHTADAPVIVAGSALTVIACVE